MLSDAISLWKSARQTVGGAVNSMTSALEQLDASGTEDIAQELEVYKDQLADAQMQHFELSKQMRLLLAEKDAEIKVLREQQADVNGNGGKEGEVNIIEQTRIELEKSKFEKEALSQNLEEMESKLKVVTRERNESKVTLTKLGKLEAQYNNLMRDYKALSTESNKMLSQKAETIDNLVAEYSHLSSETEVRSEMDEKRLIEVMKENEVLSTKLHVMEMNITELADRNSNNNKAAVNTSNKNLNGNNGMSPAQFEELSAARVTILNYEFELKEKQALIDKLNVEIATVKEVHQISTNATSERVSEAVETTSKAAADIARTQISTAVTLATESLERVLTEERLKYSKLEEKLSGAQLKVGSFEALKGENDDLKRNKSDLESMNVDLTANVKSMQQQCSDLKTELKTLVDKSNELEGTMQRYRDTEADAKNGISNIQEKHSALLSEVQQHQEMIKNLNNEKAELQISNGSKQGQYEELLKQFEEKSQLHSKIQQELTEKDNALSTTQSSLNNLKKDMTTQKTELIRLKRENGTLLETVDSNKDLHEAEMKKANASLEEAAGKQVSTEELDKLRKELMEEKENAISLLGDEHSTTLQGLKDSHENEKTNLVKEHSGALEQHKSSLETIQKEKDEHLNKYTLLQKEYEAMKSAHTTVEQEKVSLEEKITSMMSELTTSQNSYNTLEGTLTELQVKVKGFDDIIASHTNAMEGKDNEINVLNSTLSQATSDLESKIQEMKQAIQDKETAESNLTNVEERYEVKMKQELSRVEQEAAALRKIEVDGANAEKQKYIERYIHENQLRKKIHNKLLEIQGNIRVICRVRPVLEVERKGSGTDVDVTDIPNEQDIIISKDAVTKTKFEYDRVFAPLSEQQSVFDAVRPLCVSVLDGYNVCIFAYGQTGSGKTYTMEGTPSDPGTSPRAIRELFSIINGEDTGEASIVTSAEGTDPGSLKMPSAGSIEADNQNPWEYTLHFSMLEVYNESIIDLLQIEGTSNNKKKKELDIRQTKDGNAVVGLMQIEVKSAEEVLALMTSGQSNRSVGCHNMNEHSSRSHSILTLTARGKHKHNGTTCFGKLNLIDLAGSERVSKTDASGDRLKEAQNINKSLSALGDVVNALGDRKKGHVPYRNSKLTYLLQDSLSGNSKVLMFVNISPVNYNVSETVCSLTFASRCRNTELGQARKQTGKA